MSISTVVSQPISTMHKNNDRKCFIRVLFNGHLFFHLTITGKHPQPTFYIIKHLHRLGEGVAFYRGL